MTIEALINGLDGIKETGHGKYVARCPAHNDRSPSLAIKECGDGRVLLHCFAGCETEDVLSSIGLAFSDVMPEQALEHRVRRVRWEMPAKEGLQSLDHEALVVAVISNDILESRSVDEPTWSRLAQAVARIGKVRDACIPARHKP